MNARTTTNSPDNNDQQIQAERDARNRLPARDLSTSLSGRSIDETALICGVGGQDGAFLEIAA